MPCPRGCCDTYREHVASVGMRPRDPAPKKTVDHTDVSVVTTTEHYSVDRQDVHVAMRAPRAELHPNHVYESKAAGVRFRPEGDTNG